MSTPTSTSNWDDRHSAQIVEWADLALFRPSGQRTHYIIAPDPARGETAALHALHQPGSGEILFVVLHGAIDREKYTLPRFEWLGTLTDRPENVLYVADPTLDLAADLQIGWYVGTSTADAIDRIARLATSTAQAAGARRILFVGGSAGGFASLMASARVPDSRALAFNPQITISEYHRRFVNRFLEVALDDHDDFDSARAALPGRLSVLDAYPSTARMVNRALIVQNRGDSFHVDNHLAHLAAQLGLPAERTVSEDGRMEFDLRYFGEGHAMPYRHVLTRYLDLTLARWDEARVIRAEADIPHEETERELPEATTAGSVPGPDSDSAGGTEAESQHPPL